MADFNVRMASILILFGFLYTNSALKIDINPSRFRGDNETEVKISCKLDLVEEAARDIILLKISRKGEKTIAIIHPNSTVSYINGNPSEFLTTGSINKKAGNTYLNMLITQPSSEDSGTYYCSIFYIDEMGSLVEGKAGGYLTVDDPEITLLKETVKDLVSKVNKGQKLILDYKNMAVQYKGKVDDLERKTNVQGKQISNLARQEKADNNITSQMENSTNGQVDLMTILLAKEAAYNKTMDEITAKFNVQGKKIDNLLKKETQYVSKIADLERKTNIQSKEISNLKNGLSNSQAPSTSGGNNGSKVDMKAIQALISSELASKLSNLSSTPSTPIVAFSATNQNKFLRVRTGADLVFPDVIVQEGQGYDPKTGIFTVPVDGLYAFHLVLKVDCMGCTLRVQLIADLEVLARLEVGMSNDQSQGSLSAVANLKKGDEVFNKVDFASSRVLLSQSQLSVFSGYLVNTG